MTRWLFLGLLLVSLSVAVWYAYLGGFRSPDVQLTTTTQPIYLAGRYFEGKANSAEFGPLFRQAQQVFDNGQWHIGQHLLQRHRGLRRYRTGFRWLGSS